MRKSTNPIRLVATACLAAVLVACNATTPSASPVATEQPSGAAPAPVATITGSDHVRVDSPRSASQELGPDGGELTVTGADGTIYTLTIPAGALAARTAIGMAPILSVDNLPPGATLSAGVEFSPDGLQLANLATLSMQLAAGTDTHDLVGYGWHGDAVPRLALASTTGSTVTMPVAHFSFDAAGTAPDPSLEPVTSCASADDLSTALESEAHNLAHGGSLDSFREQAIDTLQSCFHDFLAPAMDATPPSPPSPESEDAIASAYDLWLAGITFVGARLGDAAFTLTPEVADAHAQAIFFLVAWFQAQNDQCLTDQNDTNVRTPLFWAETAIREARTHASSWDVADTASNLGSQALLDALCVKVVIEPTSLYTAVAPGDLGTVSVQTGFRIGDGPVRTGPNHISVKVSMNGSEMGNTDAGPDGTYLEDGLEWPAGSDPLSVDLTATLWENQGGDDEPTLISRFDRITKHAERLSFTFDHGLDGWTAGVDGPPGSSNWGLVDHTNDGGAAVILDGRGVPKEANAWIVRTFDLPNRPARLQFDVSPEIFSGTSSIVLVQIVVDGVSTIPLNQTIRNKTNAFSWSTKRVDLSQWAGKRVKVFIMMNDNTPAGTQGFDKEIYIDNVKIVMT
jgi:hypothetical protein